MAYTKDIALHDLIQIDGTDVSNSFRSFGLNSEHAQVDASGFSVSGVDENLAGNTTRSFEGEAFYTPELYAILWDLHQNRTVFEVQWTPEGLTDPTRETFYGNCQLLTFNPNATRGDVRVMTCTFSSADATGILSGAST